MDLHRDPGDPPGHLRDLRRGRRAALRRHARRHAHADRRLRRHGRRPAAGRHDERRASAWSSTSTRRGSAARRAALPRRVDRGPRRGARAGPRRPRPRRAALSVGLVGNAATVFAELLARGRRGRHRHRPDVRPRPAVATCPRASSSSDWHDYAEAQARGVHRPRARVRWPHQVEAMVGFLDAGAEVFDYGNSIRAEALARRLRARLRLPRVRAGLHPAAVLRGQGAVPLGGAVGRPADIAATDDAVLELFPDNDALRALDPHGAASGSPSRACRRASAGSATASATAPGSRSTSSSRAGDVAAPIVIGRDHLDCGSVASPYRETESMADGSRRDRRLAAAQRAAQHRVGRDVGVDPPRRRRRDRPLASTPARSASPTAPTLAAREARAGAHERPGHRGHPPRRRRLRGRRGDGAAPRRARADARGLVASLLVDGVGELTTNDPSLGRGPGGRRERRGAGRRGRPRRLGRTGGPTPRPRRARRRGRGRGRAGLRRHPHAPRLRRRAQRPSSRPAWPARPTTGGGIADTVAATRAATTGGRCSPPRWRARRRCAPGASRRWRPSPATTSPSRARRRLLRRRRGGRRRGHVPRRARRGARVRGATRGVRGAGLRGDDGGLRAARALGRRLLRRRRLRRRRGSRRAGRRRRGRPGAAPARQPARRHRRGGPRRRARRGQR